MLFRSEQKVANSRRMRAARAQGTEEQKAADKKRKQAARAQETEEQKADERRRKMEAWHALDPEDYQAALRRMAEARKRRKQAEQRCSRVTAERSANAWRDQGGEVRPPCFAALHDETNLKMISDMHEFLETSVWTTCVCCWRAWYAVDADFVFTCPEVRHNGGRTEKSPWFAIRESQVLGKWCMSPGATSLLDADVRGDLVECRCGATGRKAGCGEKCISCGQKSWLRQACVCEDCGAADDKTQPRRAEMAVDPECAPGVEDGDAMKCLGKPLSEIASPLHDLSDFEEMVIALVHPLVQVYTIPKTGELAYVGHVCNFRQHVPRFMATLPRPPCEMPFIMVRPRAAPGATNCKPRCPFPVDVQKLHSAFLWLQKHNRWYRDIVWLRP